MGVCVFTALAFRPQPGTEAHVGGNEVSSVISLKSSAPWAAVIVLFATFAHGEITPFPIYTGPGSQSEPGASGDFVGWRDYRDGEWGVHGKYLGQTDRFIITNAPKTGAVGVRGGLVVWADQRNGEGTDIFAYDLASGTEFPVCTVPGRQFRANTDGNWIVWEDGRGSQYEIYGYDVSTGTERRFTAAAGDQLGPAVSGRYVVWSDERNYFSQSDIYGYDMETDTEFAICTLPNWQGGPALSGSIVVWMDYRSGFADIWGKDLATDQQFPICTAPGEQGGAAIDGRYVVWLDFRNPNPDGSGHGDIYGYDLLTGREFAISVGPSYKFDPRISGDLVVWSEFVGDGDSNIYGAYIPEPTSLPLLGLTCLSVVLRKRRAYARLTARPGKTEHG